MNLQEYAYTDRDVRDTPQLEEIANRYVRQYTGNFQFILDCQSRLCDGYRLGTAQIRTVLNTMRADPRVRDLPTSTRTIQQAQRDVDDDAAADDDDSDDGEWLRLRPRRIRPPYIKLPARWHYEYGMSTHRRAEVIHKISPHKCSVTYYPHVLERRFHDRFRVRISWVCGAALPGAQNRNSTQYTEEWPIRLLTTDQVTELLETSARRMCPTCALNS